MVSTRTTNTITLILLLVLFLLILLAMYRNSHPHSQPFRPIIASHPCTPCPPSKPCLPCKPCKPCKPCRPCPNATPKPIHTPIPTPLSPPPMIKPINPSEEETKQPIKFLTIECTGKNKDLKSNEKEDPFFVPACFSSSDQRITCRAKIEDYNTSSLQVPIPSHNN